MTSLSALAASLPTSPMQRMTPAWTSPQLAAEAEGAEDRAANAAKRRKSRWDAIVQ